MRCWEPPQIVSTHHFDCLLFLLKIWHLVSERVWIESKAASSCLYSVKRSTLLHIHMRRRRSRSLLMPADSLDQEGPSISPVGVPCLSPLPGNMGPEAWMWASQQTAQAMCGRSGSILRLCTFSSCLGQDSHHSVSLGGSRRVTDS